jgi:hypothetical protein
MGVIMGSKSTKYNTTSSNIAEITSGASDDIPNSQDASGVRSGIPSATGAIVLAVIAKEAGKGISVTLRVKNFTAFAFF